MEGKIVLECLMAPGADSPLTYVLRFVERLRNFAREHRVHRADHNQHDGIEEHDHVGRVDVGVTHQQVVLARRVVVLGVAGRDYHPHGVDQDLEVCEGVKGGL